MITTKHSATTVVRAKRIVCARLSLCVAPARVAAAHGKGETVRTVTVRA